MVQDVPYQWRYVAYRWAERARNLLPKYTLRVLPGGKCKKSLTKIYTTCTAPTTNCCARTENNQVANLLRTN